MGTFLRQVLASMVGVFLLGTLVLFWLMNALKATDLPVVQKDSILTLILAMPLADDPVPPSVSEVVQGSFGHDPTPLHRFIGVLDQAAADPRIVGLHLTGSVAAGGWAGLRELRQAILRFRASGKQVSAWFPSIDEASYYLASAGDLIWLAPFGGFEWNGFQAESQYYGGAFRRYGVEVQVTRVGKYKSAVEPYMLDQMSAENREQVALLLGDLEDVRSAESAAEIEPQRSDLDRVAQESGLLTGAQAVDAALITAVLHRDEMEAELRQLTGEEDADQGFRSIWLEDYLAAEWEDDPWTGGGMVVVLFAEGEIVDGRSEIEVGGDSMAAKIRAVRLDDEVAALVLRVNSPGGSAAASEVILREVELCAQVKPVIVSMGDVAASGGYWISSQASEIYAQPSTITGSIGVFGMLPNVAGLAAAHGIKIETVQTAPHANLWSMWQSKSDATLAGLQASVDEVYDAFLERVSRGRALERDAVHQIAQGRVWSGKRALELGLVDQLGSLQEAVERAADRAGLKEGFGVSYRNHEPELWEQILAELAMNGIGQIHSGSPLPAEVQHALQRARRLLQARGLQARMPWDLELR